MKTIIEQIKEDIYRYNEATNEILDSYTKKTKEDRNEIISYIRSKVDPYNMKPAEQYYKEVYLMAKDMLT